MTLYKALNLIQVEPSINDDNVWYVTHPDQGVLAQFWSEERASEYRLAEVNRLCNPLAPPVTQARDFRNF